MIRFILYAPLLLSSAKADAKEQRIEVVMHAAAVPDPKIQCTIWSPSNPCGIAAIVDKIRILSDRVRNAFKNPVLVSSFAAMPRSGNFADNRLLPRRANRVSG